MKKLICLQMLTLVFYSSFSQLDVSFEKDTMALERDKSTDYILHIPVNIKNFNATGGLPNTVNFAVNPSPATSLPAGDYLFPGFSRTLTPGTNQIDCPVTLFHGENPSGNVLYISIQLSYANPATQTGSIVLKISNKKEAKKDEEDKQKIMYLNAYNFDFGATSLSSNYVGHLNFFAPSSSNDKKWGFNTGVMKINYSQKDTSNSNGTPILENVFISPFDTIAAGLKYLRQYNGYKTEKRNTVWSFYVQPTFELTDKEDNFHVYAHAHLELLASKWTATTTITNIKQDTGIIAQPSNSFVIRKGLPGNSSTYTVNSLSGYFGAGFTVDVKPWDGGSFFFQPTIGFTSNRPSPSSSDINVGSKGSVGGRRDMERIWNSFYLVRAYYTHVIAEEKSTVVIGVDIRGLLPLYAPQYAVYVGLNLSLDSIFGLISSAKK